MKKRISAVIALSALLLSACSGVSPSESGKENVWEESLSAAEEKYASSFTTADLPDPHTLTGVSYVQDLPDPEPIAGSYRQNLPVTLNDVEGNSVTITDTSRIIAIDIYGTLSRIVIALGYGENIVGRTVSSTEKQLESLPVVTENGHMLNAEAVLALKPTLILADRSVGPPEALDQLRASGIPVVLIQPERSLETNTQLITSVAQALGVEEAGKALAERTEEELEAVQATIAQWKPKNPVDCAFLYMRGTAGIFFIFGTNNGASELIEGVGARDVAGANGIEDMIPANAESLVSLNPEVIFAMSSGLESGGGMEGLMQRPGVIQTRAGKSQRVVVIPDGISLSFGPQSADVLYLVAKALYGVEGE